MPMVNLELNIKEAKNLIEQMPLEDKIKLVRDLLRENWAKRINIIVKNIEERRRIHKISNKEITREIEKARRDFYACRH